MVVCLTTACSTPPYPQPLPVSAWPIVVCPPWGSTRRTCPPKCATFGNLKCRGSRLPLPTVQWCHPEEWAGSPLTQGTGTHPRCATTTSPRPSWPPSRSERRWRRGRSGRWYMGAPRPTSMPRTLVCLMGVMAYPPMLAIQMGLAVPVPEAQHPQPMEVPGTTWWGLGWWAMASEPLYCAMLAPRWAVPLGLHPPPYTQITVAPTAARAGPLALRAPIAPQPTSPTPLLCLDPPPTLIRNSPTSMPMRGQTHLVWGAQGMNPNITPVGLHALYWASGDWWVLNVFPLETQLLLLDIASRSWALVH